MTVWHCRKLTIDQQNTHRIHASTHSYSKLFAECLLYSRHCARTWGGGQINNSWNLSSLPGKKTSRCTATELNQRVCNLCRRLDEGEDRCVWGCQRRLPHSPWGPAVYPHTFSCTFTFDTRCLFPSPRLLPFPWQIPPRSFKEKGNLIDTSAWKL